MAIGSAALSEAGKAFSISSSSGSVLLPEEADDASTALLLADRRMYGQKRLRSHSAERQTRNVLLRILREREPDLNEHLRSVASLAVLLARHAGVEGEELDVVARAAELHDVGKIAIPERVLHKRGRADGGGARADPQAHPDRRAHPGRCARDGAGRTARTREPRALGRRRLSGPARGEEIPIGARIIAVCDAFDAMVSSKPYRRSLDSSQALSELRRCSGTQFDPRLVELFCEQVYPQVGDWAGERHESPTGVQAQARQRTASAADRRSSHRRDGAPGTMG